MNSSKRPNYKYKKASLIPLKKVLPKCGYEIGTRKHGYGYNMK